MKEALAKEMEQLWDHIVAATAIPASFLNSTTSGVAARHSHYWKESAATAATKLTKRCSKLRMVAIRLATDVRLRKMKKRSFWRQRHL